MGARALCQALVERTLATARRRRAAAIDLSRTRVAGALVLDMIAHNSDVAPRRLPDLAGPRRGSHRARLRDAPREQSLERGRGTLEPARAIAWARAHGVQERRRAHAAAIARHPRSRARSAPADNPQSSVYNTDGQIFSDVGIPCVLFMENYDISRSGYHDTQDTMKNIDLDYGPPCRRSASKRSRAPRARVRRSARAAARLRDEIERSAGQLAVGYISTSSTTSTDSDPAETVKRLMPFVKWLESSFMPTVA